MKDALVADIVAHPDDDDARLVWADREGGERGELVVIQCALAKGGQSREERRKLYARERELLAKPWPEADGLAAPRFERGFIVHASMGVDEIAAQLARHPLLASVELDDATNKLASAKTPRTWDAYAERLARVFGDLAPGRIAKLTGTANPSVDSNLEWSRFHNRTDDFVGVLARTEAGRALRGLRVAGDARLTPVGFAHLETWSELEELYVFGRVPVERLMASCPRLTGMTVFLAGRDDELEPLLRDLIELEVGFGFERLARFSLPKLRRLKINLVRGGSAGFHTLTSAKGLANLESLDVGGIDDWMLQYLAEGTFAANLRALTLRLNDMLSARSIPRLREAFPKLDRLDLRRRPNRHVFASVADVIPFVAL